MVLSTIRQIPSCLDTEGSIPNSQELSTCPYPEPDQSSPYHLIPPLQHPTTYVLVFQVASSPLAFHQRPIRVPFPPPIRAT
jgi:hypothetical protein